MTPVRVLIVDDSGTMRSLIRAVLTGDPEIEVAGEADSAAQARAAIKTLSPDVITLDVEMPGMNGLEFLDKIMRLRPTPVIMVSSQTANGASATIKALEIGAFDCVAKPGPAEWDGFASALTAKVKAAAGSRPRSACRTKLAPFADTVHQLSLSSYEPSGHVVAIGASTGGVEALTEILSHFPGNCPPTVITQHMPPLFTKSFAERLDRRCKPKISEAFEGAPLQSGHVYLAPGGAAHLAIAGPAPYRCRLLTQNPVNGHRPSVDVLFHSVAKSAAEKAIGVVLTGMGRDGAEGLLNMRRMGARTLVQDAASCLIYGMPRAAYELGAAERQVPLERIAAEILHMTSSGKKETSDADRSRLARIDRR